MTPLQGLSGQREDEGGWGVEDCEQRMGDAGEGSGNKRVNKRRAVLEM